MRLYATPLSHYSRKVRLLLDHYRLEYELLSPGDVSGSDASRFGNNPVMKVPVLEDGGTWLVESDHIAQYVVRKVDPLDRYRVLASDPETLNLRAVMNAIMQEEVKLILAARTGIDTAAFPFFRKARLAIENGLDWLEARAERFDAASPGYAEFHLVSLVDHLDHHGLLPREHSRLREIVGRVSASETVAQSSPRRSLERQQRQSPFE
ncbi:MAG TPA: glutathione S-transferase [Gammaproteobacteria bacterium]